MSDLRLLELMSSMTPCGDEITLSGGQVVRCTRDKGHAFHHRCTIQSSGGVYVPTSDITLIWYNPDDPQPDNEIPF